jgi:D-lactate dehydrogenase
MLPDRYQRFFADISGLIPRGRWFTDLLHTLAYGTDASFYRLIPGSSCASTPRPRSPPC